MTPYYSDEQVTLYHDDFRGLLPLLPPAQLMVADPPYDLWSELAEPVLAHPSTTVVAFSSWQHRKHVEEAAEAKFGRARAEIVWHFRDGRWVAHHLPRLTHTSILVYGEVGDAYVGDINQNKEPQHKGHGAIGRDRMARRTYVPRERKLLNSVIEAPRDVRSGVWTKPRAVMAPLIEWLATPDGLLIDPCCGAGSSIAVAKSLGLSAIGIDRDERMLEMVVEALAQGQFVL